jgi:hypothetical protein
MRWLNGEQTNVSRTITILVIKGLMTGTEIVVGMLVHLLFNQLTWLVAREVSFVLRLWFAAM